MIYKCDNPECGNEVIADIDLSDTLCPVCEAGQMTESEEEV